MDLLVVKEEPGCRIFFVVYEGLSQKGTAILQQTLFLSCFAEFRKQELIESIHDFGNHVEFPKELRSYTQVRPRSSSPA